MILEVCEKYELLPPELKAEFKVRIIYDTNIKSCVGWLAVKESVDKINFTKEKLKLIDCQHFGEVDEERSKKCYDVDENLRQFGNSILKYEALIIESNKELGKEVTEQKTKIKELNKERHAFLEKLKNLINEHSCIEENNQTPSIDGSISSLNNAVE